MNSIGSLIRDCSANDLSITRTINLRVRFRSNNGFAYNLLNRAVEMPCPTCPTWSHFIQDKLKISIYLSLDKYTKVNQGFPFKKIFRGHCDPQVVDFGGHFQFERVTY